MTRKIIQISSFFADGWGPMSHCLCDDGTVWARGGKEVEWKQLTDIPQDEDETFKCKMCKDKRWIAGPGDNHPCPNCGSPDAGEVQDDS